MRGAYRHAEKALESQTRLSGLSLVEVFVT